MFISLPNNKILDRSRLKAFADNKISLNEKLELVLGRIENMGKGENTGFQHFLLFPQCFQKLSHSGFLKVRIVLLRVNCIKSVQFLDSLPQLFFPDYAFKPVPC